jgi:FtsP/CotA-like multicopper oxidase with cupredoxin domain
MAYPINRRRFLLGSATVAATGAGLASLPWKGALAAMTTRLAIGRRMIEVNGRSASVFGIRQPDGTPGITLGPDDLFRVDLVNDAGEDLIVHWHGQKAPYPQDGVADRNTSLIAAGATQSYDYRPTPGTHWMHSHHSVQEQALMAAPMIVRSSDDLKADIQEVTVLLHDFSFRDPAEILAGLTGKAAAGGHGMHGMAGSGMNAEMKPESGAGHGMTMPMSADLNDVEYDAFLANDRTLQDPLVVQVERRGRVRLRLINGAAASALWVDLGGLQGTLVAVDGAPIEPIPGSLFPMTMAQRLDLLVDVPEAGAFPILAQVEGKPDRTGFILATPGAGVKKLGDLADSVAPAVDLSLETRLRALTPLVERRPDAVLTMALTGAMSPYQWSINNQLWPEADRPVIREGERIVIEVQNQTPMAHPMHLHGHQFQVTAVNGRGFSGAVRDTVLVPIMGSVRLAFDADNPGRWPFHCHNLYHMLTGMMTELVYENFA